MTSFPLKIVTPDGLVFDGSAEQIIVRTTTGDVAILARHINYVAPLGMGRAVIIASGARRTAACIGGVSNVLQSGAGDAPQSAMARIRDYYNDLETVEKEVAL